jgi:hypothetical protein
MHRISVVASTVLAIDVAGLSTHVLERYYYIASNKVNPEATETVLKFLRI